MASMARNNTIHSFNHSAHQLAHVPGIPVILMCRTRLDADTVPSLRTPTFTGGLSLTVLWEASGS